jgi:hypothetical protein
VRILRASFTFEHGALSPGRAIGIARQTLHLLREDLSGLRNGERLRQPIVLRPSERVSTGDRAVADDIAGAVRNQCTAFGED